MTWLGFAVFSWREDSTRILIKPDSGEFYSVRNWTGLSVLFDSQQPWLSGSVPSKHRAVGTKCEVPALWVSVCKPRVTNSRSSGPPFWSPEEIGLGLDVLIRKAAELFSGWPQGHGVQSELGRNTNTKQHKAVWIMQQPATWKQKCSADVISWWETLRRCPSQQATQGNREVFRRFWLFNLVRGNRRKRLNTSPL